VSRFYGYLVLRVVTLGLGMLGCDVASGNVYPENVGVRIKGMWGVVLHVRLLYMLSHE
jgi:hypothetical protein